MPGNEKSFHVLQIKYLQLIIAEYKVSNWYWKIK